MPNCTQAWWRQSQEHEEFYGLTRTFADPGRFDELLEEHDVEVVGPSAA
jgi:hypothetical protein